MARVRDFRPTAPASKEGVREAWYRTVVEEVGRPDHPLWPLGQDAAFASSLAERFRTVGGIIAAIEEEMVEHAAQARAQRSLSPDGSLAKIHQTNFPIAQGPMTRVSDRALFAKEVAEAGALPFLALALMKADEIDPLLRETKELMGPRSWGVGILGFVPQDLRKEQMELLRHYRPPFALIAGGRPDQAKSLEADGIATYLHVPSPGLLRMFLQEGARRFVLEGRECGGHVGPRSSFVLWDSCVDVLLDYLKENPRVDDVQVLFAGGVHDGMSAAMVAATAAPLVSRGVSIGVLSGTAYLFTEEAVKSGAIRDGFQNAAITAGHTILLESAPGYATRCLISPFADVFNAEKQRLIDSGSSGEQIKDDLEVLNIGRLRVAAKGVNRNPAYGQDPSAPRLVEIPESEQWNEGMYMIGQVASLHDKTYTVAELHDEISNGSVRCLNEVTLPDGAPIEAPAPSAVAIVGMASIVPGASDLESFWENILSKVDAVTEVPTDRWDPADYFNSDKAARDKVYSRWGGFIDDIPFDPLEFGIPPQSLTSIEPFQLLALLVVRDALKDAGYDTRPFARERTSVIMGAGGGAGDLGNAYIARSNLPKFFGERAGDIADRLEGVLPEWTEDSFAGLLMNVATGRVANRFDFGGVNYTVDAACASSLAAVYLAVRELESHTSDVVIAGGVDAIQSPFGFLCFSKTQALSPNGRSRPFDADADGIAISEGFAAVILKRLEDAERDGDRIYGVIRGVAGSSDGRARGLTAPRPEGQVRALTRAYANAGFSPSTVGLVEAHGTGTAAGDKSELESLTSLFNKADTPVQSVAVGSVKSMIGHTKATAGVAGLIKVVKALYHRVLPPTMGVETPNPQVDGANGPLYVNTMPRPWLQESGTEPRRAGVSAFGFGGTNFHAVVEEYQGEYQERVVPAVNTWGAELFVFRAENRDALLESITKLQTELGAEDRPGFAALSNTVNRRAQGSAGRAVLTLVATGFDDLQELLQDARTSLKEEQGRLHTSKGLHFSDRPLAQEGKVAFLFPGQGSQYVNMARELAVLFPSVQDELQTANDTLAGKHGQSLSRFIYPPPWFRPEDEKSHEAALTNTNVAQPALGAVEVAMMRLLGDLGVHPEMSAGHSYGEFVALYAAGVFSKEDLFLLSEARGRFMNESTGEESGTMAAILAPTESVEQVLAAFPEITPANLNAPNQTVISGTKEAIGRAILWCGERGITARQLPVACAFHSPLVAPAQEKLVAFMQNTRFSEPQSMVFSNTTAALHPDDPDAIRQLLAQHLTSPVQFKRQIEAMYDAGARLFVEAGPKRVLSGLVDQIIPDQAHLCVALDNSSRSGLWAFLNAVGALISEGVHADLNVLYEGREITHRGPAKLTATTWFVNGGGARPANAEVKKPELPLRIYFEDELGTRKLDMAPVPESATAEPAVVTEPVLAEQPPQLPVTVEPTSMPTAVRGFSKTGVMEHFQAVMRNYLASQDSVMQRVFTRDAVALHAMGTAPSNVPSTNGAIEAQAASVERTLRTKRYIPWLTEVPVATRSRKLNPAGTVLIVGEGQTAEELSSLIAAEGYRALLVGRAGGRTDSGTHVNLPADATEEQIRLFVEDLHERQISVTGLIYLAAAGGATPTPVLDRGTEFLFWLCKFLQNDIVRSAELGGASFLGVTWLGGGFGLPAGASEPLQESYWVPGFTKSLAREWPDVQVKAMDLAAHDAADSARQIFDEFLCADGLVEVGYDSFGNRQTVELREAPGGLKQEIALDKDMVILVTGGARGITAECALRLAAESPVTFVLLGRTQRRSGPEAPNTVGIQDERELKRILLQMLQEENAAISPQEIERRYSQLIREREVEEVLNRYAATGSRVIYQACDVTDPDDFGRLISEVYERFGRIDGVIHGAGVIEDRLLPDKQIASFKRVLDTKLRPLEALIANLKPDSLKFMALFSSVSARAGSPGQTDYAAANEVMNKVAGLLARRWRARVVAINWGPWDSKGMVSPEVIRQFEERGIGLIPLEEGVEFFLDEILTHSGPPPEVAIGAFGDRKPIDDNEGPRQISGLPLLRNVEASAVGDGIFEVKKRLSLSENAYLVDHVLDGRPVFPFAFAMELMAEAGTATPSGLRVSAIRDVRVLRGVILDEASTDLQVLVQQPAAENGHGLLAAATIRQANKGSIESYRAKLEFESTSSSKGFETLPALSGPGVGKPSFTVSDAYRDWLFHGPTFQAIESIEAMGPAGATAFLRPSNPIDYVGKAGSWLFDPVLIDAAFQVQLIWGRSEWGITLLPLALTRFAVFSPPSSFGELVRCEMRIRPEAKAPIGNADFWFFDSDGKLVAQLTNIESGGSEDLNRLAGGQNLVQRGAAAG